MDCVVARSWGLIGLTATTVVIEARRGLAGGPPLTIEGLPENAARELRVRVRSSLEQVGLVEPANVDVRYVEGARLVGLDLPVALAILELHGRIPAGTMKRTYAAAELTLAGELRSVRGIVPFVRASCNLSVDRILVARANGPDAAKTWAESLACSAVCACPASLAETVAHLNGDLPLGAPFAARPAFSPSDSDFVDLRGNERARRALEIAVTGKHAILLLGAPGSGCIAFARRAPTIMPRLDEQTAFEANAIRSVSWLEAHDWYAPPFSAPHHTVSAAGLLGGGHPARPGEVSIAHGGVLLLDQVHEFRSNVLDDLDFALRERESLHFPASPMIVATSDPSCTSPARMRLESWDMKVELERLTPAELLAAPTGNSSAVVRSRVEAARAFATELGRPSPNGDDRRAGPSPRTERVARTIADLAASECVLPEHREEARSFAP